MRSLPKLFFISFFFISFNFIHSQTSTEVCGAGIANQNGDEFDCSLVTGLVTNSESANPEVEIYYIPTVIHLVNPIGSEIITSSEAESFIQELNNNFRGINPNSLDAKIEFILANIEHDNQCGTGITENESPLTNTSSPGVEASFDPVTEVANWDQSRYLNIWIVSEISGAAGYSSFPFLQIPGREGIVIEYDLFDSGLTHEAGHYLGLLHVFGCIATCEYNCGFDSTQAEVLGDFVEDTNPVFTSLNSGFPDPNSSQTGICDETYAGTCYDSSCPVEGGDFGELPYPKENFMSYSVFCHETFTPKQVKRMNYHLNTTYLRDIWYPGYIIKKEMIVDKETKFHRCEYICRWKTSFGGRGYHGGRDKDHCA